MNGEVSWVVDLASLFHPHLSRNPENRGHFDDISNRNQRGLGVASLLHITKVSANERAIYQEIRK